MDTAGNHFAAPMEQLHPSKRPSRHLPEASRTSLSLPYVTMEAGVAVLGPAFDDLGADVSKVLASEGTAAEGLLLLEPLPELPPLPQDIWSVIVNGVDSSRCAGITVIAKGGG